jgi:hypothetical protein
MHPSTPRLWIGAIAVLSLLLVCQAARAELFVLPSKIETGLFYHGGRIEVETELPVGSVAVFRLLGPTRDLRLKLKGRVAGIVWASVGEVHFTDVPALFLVNAVPQLPAPEVLMAESLTPASLEGRVLETGAGERERRAFGHMLELFKLERSYAVGEAGERTAGGVARSWFDLPAEAPEGRYEVSVCIFVDGTLTKREVSSVRIERAGLVATISRFAGERPALYGTVAVLVALLTGLGVGLLFGSSKGGH